MSTGRWKMSEKSVTLLIYHRLEMFGPNRTVSVMTLPPTDYCRSNAVELQSATTCFEFRLDWRLSSLFILSSVFMCLWEKSS
jgi:hypothetical protein